MSKWCTREICFLIGFCITTLTTFVFAGLFGCYHYKYTHYVCPIEEKEPDWKIGFVSEQVELNFQHNAVASDATVCGILGAYVLNVLKGTAMDAAVSTALCIGAANPHSAGIGGGSMLMYYDRRTQNVTTFNYREVAPVGAHQDMYNNTPQNTSKVGGLAIAVPGEVKGLSLAHSRFGRLPWKSVVLPVVELLRNGVPVTKALADAIKIRKDQLSDTLFSTLNKTLVNPATGRYYVEGEIRRDPELAATLEVIADNPNSFYNGDLARSILQELNSSESIINETDFLNYQVSSDAPVVVNLAKSGRQVVAMPPPSSGAVVAFVLNVLDGYGMTASAKDELDSYVDFHHRLLEALKFGDRKRTSWLGDPNFVNLTEWLVSMTAREFAATVRSKISDSHVLNPEEYCDWCYDWKPQGGTTHLSLVDSMGNAVVVTSTINLYFGSLIRGNQTGIIYNNQMDDFAKPDDPNAAPNNFIKPRKRPASSAAPTFVIGPDGGLELAVGAAGGAKIVSAVAGSLARQLFFNDTVKLSTDAFRLYQICNQTVKYNQNYSSPPKEIIDELEKRGHKFEEVKEKTVIESVALFNSDQWQWQASGDAQKPSRPNGY